MACSERKCFTFLWKLENIRYCLQRTGKEIISPAFVVDVVEKTKWLLRLYPRGEHDGNFLSCTLNRSAESKGAFKVRIIFELALLAKDGSVLAKNSLQDRDFIKSEASSYFSYNREEIFFSRRAVFLPKDTLTIRCRIWKADGEMEENIRCTAHTRIEVEKTFFLWEVQNFSTFEPDKKCSYQIKSLPKNVPLFSVNVSLIGGLSSEEIIRFELSLQDQTIKFSTFKLFLITDSGSRVEYNREELWFDNPAETKQLTFSLTKNTLLEEKSIYLPNDTLSLLWKCVFSKGLISTKSEEDQYGSIYPEIKISNAQKFQKKNTNISNCLMDNLKSLYDEHFLTDVKLKTNTNAFPAHKLILSASSLVFKSMFSSNMNEKVSECVNIEDLSDDTISQMLHFMYTARVEDLTWERASHLYEASDKYAIFNLKDMCSSYIKRNLSVSNACEALLLSDLHTDGDLKSIVQDYILRNGKQIVNSDEWKFLIQTNSRLAAETLSLLF